MTKTEMVLELTLCAMEKDMIAKTYYPSSELPDIEKDNTFAAKQVTDFYNYLFENIKLTSDK